MFAFKENLETKKYEERERGNASYERVFEIYIYIYMLGTKSKEKRVAKMEVP